MIWLLRGLIALGLLYVGVVALLFAFQRSLIYLPPNEDMRVPAGFERVTYRTADGLELAAAWKPGRADLPAVIWLHGNGDSLDGSATGVAELVTHGHAALLVEYRGYGRNPGAPDEAGLYADGRAARAWLAAQGWPVERQVLIGHSLGSGVATQLALEAPPRGLVLISPFLSIPDVVAARFSRLLPADLLVRDRFATKDKLARIEVPKLILHDRDDRAIPAEHGAALARLSGAELRLTDSYDHQLAYAPVAQRAVASWVALLPGAAPDPL